MILILPKIILEVLLSYTVHRLGHEGQNMGKARPHNMSDLSLRLLVFFLLLVLALLLLPLIAQLLLLCLFLALTSTVISTIVDSILRGGTVLLWG